MRIALPGLLGALMLIPRAASAAEIVGPYTMACPELATHERMARVARTGDRLGLEALINAALASGCDKVPVGTQVRVEETSGGFACVARIGTAAACKWIEGQEVRR